MSKLPVLVAVCCLLSSACGSRFRSYPYASEYDPRAHEYVIGVSDALRITVWKNPELTTETRVRPDGVITMPLVGDIHADGLTPGQLRDLIATKLSAFVRDPSAVVSVAVVEINSYRVTVAGNVMQPGVFPSRQYLTVAEAIALAGGLNRFASIDEVVVVRKEPDRTQRRIPIDYNGILTGTHPESNLVLVAGDTVFVP